MKGIGPRAIVALVILGFLVAVLFGISLFFFHPWLEISAAYADNSIIVAVTNTGTLNDEYLTTRLNGDTADCLPPVTDSCRKVPGESLAISCEVIRPAETLAYRCGILGDDGRELQIVVESRYQTANHQFSCAQHHCVETTPAIKGSFPHFSSYAVFYPIDMLFRLIEKIGDVLRG